MEQEKTGRHSVSPLETMEASRNKRFRVTSLLFPSVVQMSAVSRSYGQDGNDYPFFFGNMAPHTLCWPTCGAKKATLPSQKTHFMRATKKMLLARMAQVVPEVIGRKRRSDAGQFQSEIESQRSWSCIP